MPLARAGRIELPTVPADCGQIEDQMQSGIIAEVRQGVRHTVPLDKLS